MKARSLARSLVGNRPALKQLFAQADQQLQVAKHSGAARFPWLLRPRTRNLTVAITARCNLRCEGCRYGRDFMPGHELPLGIVETMLEDAAEAGVESIRLYGGEPLLHRDLPRMVERAVELGLDAYVTTNATLLERRIDELHAAGLRFLTIGFYGTDEAYESYVGRGGAFARIERGVAAVRERFGDEVRLRLNWLLMRPTCNLRSLEGALDFARRYKAPVQIDLIHYSLPYFSEGPERRLQFRPEDRPAIDLVVGELLRVQREEPGLIEQGALALRSIPDWLIQGPAMRVPCDKYEMLWIGADGTVQLCYVTFRLGNLHQTRLRDILYTREHREAGRKAFGLQCPNCHCGYDSRTAKHAESRRRYSGKA